MLTTIRPIAQSGHFMPIYDGMQIEEMLSLHAWHILRVGRNNLQKPLYAQLYYLPAANQLQSV